MKVKSLSCLGLFATPWTVAYQAPQSMDFSRQEYWSGLPSPSPGDLPNAGIEPWSPALQADTLPSEPPGKYCLSKKIFKSHLRTIVFYCLMTLGLPGGSDGKESTCNAGDWGLIPGSGRSLGEGNGNLLQYSCRGNPTDRGAWWAIVHGVAKSQT